MDRDQEERARFRQPLPGLEPALDAITLALTVIGARAAAACAASSGRSRNGWHLVNLSSCYHRSRAGRRRADRFRTEIIESAHAEDHKRRVLARSGKSPVGSKPAPSSRTTRMCLAAPWRARISSDSPARRRPTCAQVSMRNDGPKRHGTATDRTRAKLPSPTVLACSAAVVCVRLWYVANASTKPNPRRSRMGGEPRPKRRQSWPDLQRRRRNTCCWFASRVAHSRRSSSAGRACARWSARGEGEADGESPQDVSGAMRLPGELTCPACPGAQ